MSKKKDTLLIAVKLLSRVVPCACDDEHEAHILHYYK